MLRQINEAIQRAYDAGFLRPGTPLTLYYTDECDLKAVWHGGSVYRVPIVLPLEPVARTPPEPATEVEVPYVTFDVVLEEVRQPIDLTQPMRWMLWASGSKGAWRPLIDTDKLVIAWD